MTTTPALKLSEAQVEKTVCDLLIADGWRVFKMERQFSEKKRKAVGEEGMPDRLAIRYLEDKPKAEVLWIELKAKGKRPAKHQYEWAYEERRRGALLLVVDDPDAFTRWYVSSGLNRRMVA